MVATDDLDRTATTLNDRLNIGFGELLTLTTETTAGEHDLQSVIDDTGIGIDVVQSTGPDADDAVAQYVDEYGTGLYALAFQVADLEEARAHLAADGVEPVGEISAGEFTEYLFHPRDFDGLFVFLAEFPHAFEINRRLEVLREQK
ncbi:VOC family protein [Natronorubrum sp. FCH18a]|uniref:VOC family protein n=1 Tax=Natronorubrum sp. FCH18a TaxID=3447018 RepID=UPI003F516052